MANPRKFSEKIALHNQKQAEETAAFEAILREVSETTKFSSPANNPDGYCQNIHKQQQQHLQLAQPHLGAYRGGSLPNVNQMGNHSIDLQGALHNLEDMKQISTAGRQSLVDRFHREKQRQIQGHNNRRQPFPLDKRIDCSPYGPTGAYLSPPPDSSWRRTNSDSALHTSTMTPPMHQMPGGTTPPMHRRVDNMSGGVLENSFQVDTTGQVWDPKKQQQQFLSQSRPKSCEVPGINIYPSPEQDSGIHIPISNNTGSLPDLTNLHFPSPMTTPLDNDEAQQQAYAQGGNLSPTSAHHMGGQVCPNQQQTSPGTRRRHPQGGPQPLVLQGSPTQMRHNMAPQASCSLEANISRLALDNRLHQKYGPYEYHLQHSPHRQPQQQTTALSPPSVTPPRQLSPSPTPIHNIGSNDSQQQQQQHFSPPDHGQQLTNHMHLSVGRISPNQQATTSMTQYRNNNKASECPQSPTSPLSQHSYSPSQSPGLPNNTPFSDAYYTQQQATNALQHQFEQFNMLPDGSGCVQLKNNGMMYSGQMIPFSQAELQDLTGSQEYIMQPQQQQQQPQQQQPQQGNCYYTQSPQQPSSPQQQSPQPSSPQAPNTPQGQIPPSPTQPLDPYAEFSPQNNSNNIPDIIFTGADEQSRQDFAKDIVCAMAGMSDSFDSELFPSDEVLKVGLDPLDLDGLQMLTDPNMVTDPANEDSFRLDRL